LERAGAIRETYDKLQSDRRSVFLAFYKAFAVLLFMTMVVTVVLGLILARGVTRRINRLAMAINVVAQGDLSVRVPVTGSDELTELARVFNRMLTEMQQSRARIEYLQRIGAWQEMAQRLAHEIKNPLTPIQLAVQECHRKYGGEDSRYGALLDTTLEIVEEEVGTLRRLVGNFSSFARLPQAELTESDLREFLRDCSEQLTHLARSDGGDGLLGEDGFAGEASEAEPLGGPQVQITWHIPETALPVAIDKQMLRRVLVNLVRNAVQAIRDMRAAGRADGATGQVSISTQVEPAGVTLLVEDDGPGVPEGTRERIFDPYFTTKVDGTGLGLAIVKKIVVEHGGSIEVGQSARLGGAMFSLHLPDPSSPAIAAVHEHDPRVPAPRPSRRALL
jgi:nitrogen fixation/metabolism regulation signal transduction histidine kinase